MFDKLYNSMATAYYTARDPLALVQKLERGDADSSGSTLRTIGIVVLVLAVIGVIGAAVMIAGHQAANDINSSSFNFQ